MITFLSILWFIRTTKALLFWIYLWQLKDYHIGRFIDHFRTAKGKTLFLNPLFFVKIILFLISLSLPWQDYGDGFIFILIALYVGEAILTGRAFLQGKLLRPVFTLKTAVLGVFCVFVELLCLVLAFRFLETFFISLLLLFDIALPSIVALIVLSFQPLAVLGRKSIIQRAKWKRATFTNLKVIGITGSYGKTSTKEFLFAILQKKFKMVKTPEHRNSEVGVAQTILQDLRDDTEIFICEMGAYNRGGIRLLASIAKPEIAILCGANEQHLATFGSMENLLSAEGGKELVESLPSEGVAIFNGANRFAKELYEKTKLSRKILSGSDIVVAKIQVKKDSVSFRARTKEEAADFEVHVIGEYNIQNLLLAISCAKECGMSFLEIAEACKDITQEMTAMKLRKGVYGLNVIDSTYSANPDGVIAALEYLKVWEGKKILVMPCLIELGAASSQVHRRIGRKIAEVCDLAIITTSDRVKELREGAGSEKIWYSENPIEIFQKIQSFRKAGLPSEALAKEDVVLLESRVPATLIRMLLP